ncbi:FAD-dependent oxidoreductase [Jhaorihella thermophila]
MTGALAMVDVTVRGAGIFGLSIAWECACRGARVQVVDPAGPGTGASGGLVGALAPHVPEKLERQESLPAGQPADGPRLLGGGRGDRRRVARLCPHRAAATHRGRPRAGPCPPPRRHGSRALVRSRDLARAPGLRPGRLGAAQRHGPRHPRHAQRPHVPPPRLRGAGRGTRGARGRGAARGPGSRRRDPRHRHRRAGRAQPPFRPHHRQRGQGPGRAAALPRPRKTPRRSSRTRSTSSRTRTAPWRSDRPANATTTTPLPPTPVSTP